MGREKTRSRREINREVADRGKDMNKRLKEGKRILKDKNIEQETADKAQRSGTSDGLREIDTNMKRAADATDKAHQKKEGETKKIFEKQRRTEHDVKKRVTVHAILPALIRA